MDETPMSRPHDGTVSVNDVEIAYRVDGAGPPLLLIMGYRLSSHAWPDVFIAALSAHFTVVRFDNRGTGQSGKPLAGYALANLARDARGLLDHLGISRTHMLGYSMGGAIAQEFVRQFPERVAGLVLCATMCGGALATYAALHVQRTMHRLEGLTPSESARQIWTVTYADGYLAEHRNEAEQQMQREIAQPTPLHAADLQFQALTSFDTSAALPSFRCPTLVLTGDEDRLIPPRNTSVLATLIPDARKVVMRGRGHRVLWEATDECVSLITDFLQSVPPSERRTHPVTNHAGAAFASVDENIRAWSSSFAQMTARVLKTFDLALSPMLRIPFGDGKPVMILPSLLFPRTMTLPLEIWLETIGYRPHVVGSERELFDALEHSAALTHRKAVVLAFDSATALSKGANRRQIDRYVSDFVLVNALPDADDGVHVHRLALTPAFAVQLGRTLHAIPIELL